MKRLMCMMALGVGLTAAPAVWADAYTMSITSGVYGEVSFNGASQFSFGTTNNSLYSFQIGAAGFYDPANPGISTAVGMYGELTGTYTIGAISGNSASVTGSGQFIINDGNGHNLTANLSFSSITDTHHTDIGLNDAAVVNLTNFTYSGTDQNLIDLTKHLDGGSLTVDFSFNAGYTLAQLKGTDTTKNGQQIQYPLSTTFSGTMTAAPAPASCVLMLTGGLLSGLGFLRRRILRLA